MIAVWWLPLMLFHASSVIQLASWPLRPNDCTSSSMKNNRGKIRLWYRGVCPDFTHHSVQKNAFKICPSPARYLQSVAPHQAFKHSAGTNSSGMSKAKVLRVFALQTSWAMWEENGCHLLGLINEEHADVQFGRICFWWSLHGKWIWRKTTGRGCWRCEGASQLSHLTASEFFPVIAYVWLCPCGFRTVPNPEDAPTAASKALTATLPLAR